VLCYSSKLTHRHSFFLEDVSLTVHVPVLTSEIIESLQLKRGSIVVDGTLGGGGHATDDAAVLHGVATVVAAVLRQKM